MIKIVVPHLSIGEQKVLAEQIRKYIDLTLEENCEIEVEDIRNASKYIDGVREYL